MAIKCSSFCKMNVGTSRRIPCASIGYLPYPSVREANKLLERTAPYYVEKSSLAKYVVYMLIKEVLPQTTLQPKPSTKPYMPSLKELPCELLRPPRTVLLCWLTTSLQGCFVLEQPSGSMLEFHPTFREMLLTHYLALGFHCVQPLHDGLQLRGICDDTCTSLLDKKGIVYRIAESYKCCQNARTCMRQFLQGSLVSSSIIYSM